MDERQRLLQAISALEAQRAVLGDIVVDASLAALREKLAALEPAPSEAPRTQQRKQVTVLFADLLGFTALSESLDAEDVRDLINSLWQRLDHHILDHGGMIDKHIGDAVMALWGVQAAREDDPQRAVQAALAIQQEAATFSPTGQQARLALRVGVHTGMVLLGEVGTTAEFTAVGDTVSIANRLEHAARPGDVLISQDTYQQVRGLFDFEPQAPLEIKGKNEILDTYHVLRERERAFFVPRRGIEGIQTFMVGRDSELLRLQEALQAAVRQNRLQKMLVVGEAGLGKSRLVQEFEKGLGVLPQQVLALRARAEETRQALSFGLARDIFAYQFDIQESDSQSTARRKLETGILGYLGKEAAEQAHFIGQMLGLDFSSSPFLSAVWQDSRQVRDRAFYYSLQFLEAACKRGPVVLLLEDLHWADDASLDWIAYLRQAASGLPILILGAARPSLFRRRPEWGQGGEGLSLDEIIELQPLSSEDSRRLTLDILRRVRDLPAALLDTVTRQAEGNPFYLEELIKVFIESGVIMHSGQDWRVDPARLGDLRVPATLAGLLQARLDRLSPSASEIIQRSAVIGRVFWDDAVAHLADPAADPASQEFQAALHELKSRELTFASSDSAFAGANEYRFKHTLLREVAYDRVLKARRRTFHQRAARWLVERSGERALEFAALIADHFERAGETRQAAEWRLRAGHAARAAYSLEMAISHYRKALELAGADFSLSWRIPLLEGLGETLHMRAYFTEAAQVYQELYAAGLESADLVSQLHGLFGIRFVADRQHQYEKALQLCEQATELARAHPEIDPAERAWAIWSHGMAFFRLGRLEEALELAQESLALAVQSGVKARQADNYNLLGIIAHGQGQHRQAQMYLEKSLAVWRELKHRPFEAALLSNLGESARGRGDYRAALAYYRETLEIYRQIGERDGKVVALVNAAGVFTNLGEYDQAIAHLEQATVTEGQAREMVCEWYGVYALAFLGRGQLQEALQKAQEAIEAGQRQNSPPYLGLGWRVLGEVSARMGQPVPQNAAPGSPSLTAAECFSRAVEIFRQLGARSNQGITLWRWSIFEERQGDPDRAISLASQVRAIFTELDFPLFLAHMLYKGAPVPA